MSEEGTPRGIAWFDSAAGLARALGRLVVRGQHDPICRADWAERVARGLPNGSLVVIPEVAHTLVFTAPQQLAAVARPFLGE